MLIAIIAVSSADITNSRSELVHSLLEQGHKILFLTPEQWDAKKCFNSDSAESIMVCMERTGINPFADLKTLRECKRILSKTQPELLYAFSGAKAVIYGLKAKPPKCAAYCTINGLGSVFRSASGFKNAVVRTVMKLLYKGALKCADGVMFQNDDDRQTFVSMGLVKADKTGIVNGSGVNLQRYPQSPLGDKPSFLFVGRLLKDKGIEEFLAAAKKVKEKYPQAIFSIVGPLDSNPMAIDRSRLDQYSDVVTYHGKQDQMLPFYQSCTVFVLPSYHEGTPRTTLEAMAVGRAVLTTDAPGCRETVENGYNGFMVPVGDSELLAEKMMWFIENPKELQIMANNSRRMAEDKYDVDKVNAQMRRIMGV